ncbi:EpsI family protein [Sphingomonas koreensis]|nr:EpsI family protein [Sphingomonas koreensis]
MMMPDRRQLLFSGVLLGATAAAGLSRGYAARPALQPAVFARAVPLEINGYRAVPATSIVLPPRDALSERIYDRYIARGYVAPGLPSIMLVIAYGSTQDLGLQLHRPETCYPASGWAIGPSQPVPIALAPGHVITGTALSASRPGRQEEIVYWTRIGQAFPATLWQDRVAILSGSIRRRIPDGVLIRLSTSSAVAGEAIDALLAFNTALISAVGPAMRQMLIGSAA